ncbi:hypothetical protein LX87_02383 [Larkinella arboricola]|uniref:Secreted protein (Por secretion system target) n=1 Tax=Larkinella arboricola TaxID=643671 RepID=A0A327WVZ0_LARAB|nr:hypothetical protein [Larkinella arboricola]RAJ97481.1 hypothetical protein LX87_02383 [Larkinella arboricola]
MKTIGQQLLMALFLGLIVPVSNAQPTHTGNASTEQKAFDVNLFLGQREKINLMLAVRQPRRVTIRLKDARNAVLYKESLTKIPASHWRKFNFEGMKTGTYYLEISNGDQVVVRRIEVGAIPATETQRFISYAN